MKRLTLLVALLLAGADHVGLAQDACRAPALTPSKEPNVFSEAQEAELGDVIVDTLERSFGVIEDDALNAPLRQVGERLMKHLPPNSLRIRFSLMDIPSANAFTLPGGRIYVSRKMISLTQNEDELAGVLGHELGHVVARHLTITLSRQLREVLGVTQVGDRGDIFAKYNKLMDNAARKPGAFKSSNHNDREQIEADRLGVFVVAAAGYDAKAHVTLFDRLAETQGKTGSFLSTLFGTTTPDARRLGELIRTTAQLPAGCTTPPPRSADAYRRWQSEVTAFNPVGRKESLQGVVARVMLTPSLRGEVRHLRFSPDGKFVLAQDDAGISVLSRDPFRVLFRIDAPDAEPAQFTPDSSTVVFHSNDLRVDRWSIADRRLSGVRDLVRLNPCTVTALAPDGRSIACLDVSYDLLILDVESGATIFKKEGFGTRSNPLLVTERPLRFSPDGRYLVAGYTAFGLQIPTDFSALVYDMTAKKVISLRTEAQFLLTSHFAFLGPDRVIGLDLTAPAKSGILTLSTGQISDRMTLPHSEVTAATKGDFVFLRPFQKYAVGVLNLAKQTVVKVNPLEGFDLYGDVYVAERGTGDIGLYTVDGNQVLASVALPETSFGRLQAAAVSPDFRYLAVSERSRGAVWEIATGNRAAQVRGFRGAVFDDAGVLLADMPEHAGEPRAIMRINPQTRQVAAGTPITGRDVSQRGRWLLTTRTIPPNTLVATGIDLELRDIPRNMQLWRRTFPTDPPRFFVSPFGDSVVLGWQADSKPARDRIREDERLRRSVDLGDLQGDYVLDVLDGERVDVRGRVYLETGKGSFAPVDMYAVGEWLVVHDSQRRVLVFSLATGELTGYALGRASVPNLATGLIAVDAGSGRVSVHDLKTMARRSDFTFSHPIEYATFNSDGTMLIAIAENQVAYVLSVANRDFDGHF